MACLSSSVQNFVAISVKNKLRVYKDNVVILSFINIPTSADEKRQYDGNKGTSNFVCHKFSLELNYFAAVTDNKKLIVWDLTKSNDQLVMTNRFPKRPTSIAFFSCEKAIIVSDKYGDIYKCEIREGDTSTPILLLGHLSMVLGIEVTENDQYIISADRDEKIRISHYPNTYSIHNYCLGHESLVSCTKVIRENLLLSTSADKTIRLWNFCKGEELCSFDLKECYTGDFVPLKFDVRNDQVVLISENSTKVVFFQIKDATIRYESSQIVNFQPMDVRYLENADVLIMTSNKQKQLVLLSLAEYTYEEKYCPYLLDSVFIEDLDGESKYLTNLVKPIRGKRADLITPDSTINHENVYDACNKKQKIEE